MERSRPEIAPKVPTSRSEPVSGSTLLVPCGSSHSRALSHEMNDAAFRQIPALDARPRGPEAKVRLFKVHEVALVELPDLSEHRRTHHHARSAYPVDSRRLGRCGRRDGESTQHPRCQSQPQHRLQLTQGAGEPERAQASAAVGIHDTTAANADGRVFSHMSFKTEQRTFQDDGVRVEQPYQVERRWPCPARLRSPTRSPRCCRRRSRRCEAWAASDTMSQMPASLMASRNLGTESSGEALSTTTTSRRSATWQLQAIASADTRWSDRASCS